MDNFYVIKLINTRSGTRGFVLETEEGISLSDVFIPNNKQFTSKEEANKYVREHKLERKGCIANIWSNDELISDGGVGKPIDKPLFTLVNLQGDNIFYEAAQSGYYFANRDVGYCFWDDKVALQKFISEMEFEFEVFIKEIS